MNLKKIKNKKKRENLNKKIKSKININIKTKKNITKKLITITLILIFTASILFTGCNNIQQNNQKQINKTNNKTNLNLKSNKIKIGFIAPLSGEYAHFGNANLKSAKMAIEKLNNIEIIAQDSKLNPKEAILAYQKLKNIDKIDALIVLSTPVIEGLKPHIKKDKMPTIVIFQDLNAKPDYIFHISDSVFLPYQELGKEMRKYNKSVFIIEETSWIKEVENNFKKTNKNKSEIIYFNSQDNPSTIIAKMKNENYQAFSIDATIQTWIPLYKKINELNLDKQIEHILNYNEETNLKSGSFNNKIPKDFFEGKKAISMKVKIDNNFAKKYKEKYNEDLIFYASYGYDAIMLFAKTNLTNKESWIENMQNNNLKAITGEIKFDENGDRIPNIIHGRIINASFIEN